jgi:hypothetical protein
LLRHDETHYAIRPGPDHLARLWPAALRIMRTGTFQR